MAQQSQLLQHNLQSQRADPSQHQTKDVRLRSSRMFGNWRSTTTHHAPGFWNLLNYSGAHQKRREKLPFEDPPEDIKRFSRNGGPDLSNIRGYVGSRSVGVTFDQSEVQPASSRERRRSTDMTVNTGRVIKSNSKRSKSGRSSAYHADFMNLLISNGIERPQRVNKPANYYQLRERLGQRRALLPSSKLSEADYEVFLDAVDNAFDEAQVMSDVFSIIKGPQICPSATNKPCYNWAPLVTADLVAPQPDFFDGSRQTPEDSELREALYNVIVPSSSSDAPFLANFLAEVKAPGGSSEVVRRQATYDGAFGARAMHYLQAYGAEEVYDQNSYTLTSTYADGKLEIFAHYLTQPDNPGKGPRFHMVSLGQWLLTQNLQSFRDGVAAFRNARDVAQEFRQLFIAEARTRILSLPSEVKKQKWMNEDRTKKETSAKAISEQSSHSIVTPMINMQGSSSSLHEGARGGLDPTIVPAAPLRIS